jgi:RES domain-containing protein
VIEAWRIVKRRWAATAFDGEGARRFGGRWNAPGRPVVYV